MDHTDNRDAIGLVAILCSLLVIAMLIAGVAGVITLSAKLVGALVLPAITDFHTQERMVFCARRPLLHRINARRWALLGGCVVAFIALFLAGVLK